MALINLEEKIKRLLQSLKLGCPKMPENNDIEKQEDRKRETEKAC